MPKTALVTGGSRGIGRAIASTLGQAGYQVAINYLANEKAAQEVVQTVEGSGGKAITVQADVSDPAQLKRLVMETEQQLGAIDLLVNNAGITRDNLLIRMSAEEWRQVLQTNLLSVIELSELVAEGMCQRGHGQIINISSVVGVHGNAGQANYATAKAGLLSFTKIMARELMPKVQVNSIAPGLVATDMTAKFDLSALSDSRLGRAAQPQDVADCVRWLAEQGQYVTGQIIEIDGGLSLWSEVRDLAG